MFKHGAYLLIIMVIIPLYQHRGILHNVKLFQRHQENMEIKCDDKDEEIKWKLSEKR